MSKRTVQDITEETLQRVIRTETRLMTLGTKLGHDLKFEEDITVANDLSVGAPVVLLKTLDVPYTAVIRAARRAGLHKQKVRVYYDGELVAEMPV